ncbi:uroporphyrinogen-III synthase, partial [Isoptericola sp. QY 916]|nr:uroporphyrinogen-III synthase [Isoptericola sp. QY 916]
MAGCTVLVTADRRSGELAAALERRGASVRHAPALSMIPHVDDDALIAATRALVADPPDVVVATNLG